MRHQEKDRSKIILGIDPGSIACGFGVISAEIPKSGLLGDSPPHTDGFAEKNEARRAEGLKARTCALNPAYIASGRIVLSSRRPLNTRLKELYDALTDIIKEYSPDEVAVEKIFFAKSVKAALTLGQARGAVLLAAASCGLPVYEYSALSVKKAIVGYGRAEKHQVQGMVSKMLNLKSKLSKDSADALAIALCHTNTLRLGKL